jgi:hypothetical protein
MKANLTGFGLQRRLPPFLALPVDFHAEVSRVFHREVSHL